MEFLIGVIIGSVASLVARKLITGQPLLKASADAWVDKISDKYKEKVD